MPFNWPTITFGMYADKNAAITISMTVKTRRTTFVELDVVIPAMHGLNGESGHFRFCFSNLISVYDSDIICNGKKAFCHVNINKIN